MTLSPAEKYLSRVYEECIDKHLDLGAIQHHLAAKGINRSLVQVHHDLDHVLCYHGYADSHPALAPTTLPDGA